MVDRLTGSLFGFVQLELPGETALPEGRYAVRAPGSERSEEPEHVLVVRTLGAERPRGRLRRRRPRRLESGDPSAVPLTRATVVIASRRMDSADQASEWLRGAARDREARDALLAEALAVANRAIHAHRIAARDPGAPDLSGRRLTSARLGYGAGEQVADGEWTEALELPLDQERGRRVEALRPQERVAAVLSGREAVEPCEELILRARADLDAGRIREAALQLRVGLEALLAGLGDGASPANEADDVRALQGMRAAVIEAEREALETELSSERTAQVAEALAVCERVLRRRAVSRE